MTAYNLVRMRVKAGREEEFLASFPSDDTDLADKMMNNGLRKLTVIKTGGERSYCIIGEWDDMEGIVAMRPDMIGMLATQRDLLEDLGGDLGVTDPVSGSAVAEISADDAEDDDED